MSDFTITIVGTGVIGTSMGLALKQQADPPRLIAHDKELTISQAAVSKGAFDKAEWNLVNACESADLIIFAMPLNGIHLTLEAIAPYLKPGVVITDTCRSATTVQNWAKELLPPHAHFISGDPLVTPNGVGYQHAHANLFKGRPYCLIPSPQASEEAMQTVVNLIGLLEAEPFFLDAAEHDGLITTMEPLPALLGVALFNTLTRQPSWRESRKFAGRLFEQVSAGAVGNPDAVAADWLASRANLVHWLDRYLEQLQQIRHLLLATESEPEPLAQLIDKAVVERYNWQQDYEAGRFIDPELTIKVEPPPGFMKRWMGLGR